MTQQAAILSLIGNTPLIRLAGPSARTGCEILGKAEFLNPGGSVKDRTALGMIRAAERDGRLGPGGVIVEGTAGNTGIGLGLVGAALGYEVVVVMPATQSAGKKSALAALGCKVIEVDPAPFSSDNHFVHFSRRLAESLADRPGGAFWANQFDNTANRDTHYETTGVEIWTQTDGRIDGFVCAAGSGGTLAGVARRLRENAAAKGRHVEIALADPHGAGLYHYFKSGEMKAEGSSITEGIGVSRITGNLEGVEVDDAFQIPDAEFLPVLFALAHEEGLSLGGSAGVNVAGAIRLAEKLGPGHTIVTVLGDGGARYAEKLYNAEFLSTRGLPVPPWAETSPDAQNAKTGAR